MSKRKTRDEEGGEEGAVSNAVVRHTFTWRLGIPTHVSPSSSSLECVLQFNHSSLLNLFPPLLSLCLCLSLPPFMAVATRKRRAPRNVVANDTSARAVHSMLVEWNRQS
jgi:hypothetical protein